MTTTRPAIKLTDEGVRLLLDAAIEHANKMGVPQCVAIVDEGRNLMTFFRMARSRVLGIQSAQHKAMTAASTGRPTGSLAPSIDLKLAIATDSGMVNIKGGMPIIVGGHVIGGIGVGSSIGDQDLEVANAALNSLSGPMRS